MADLFIVPQYIVTGENALESGMQYLNSFGKKPLIVTDSMMVKLGNVERLTSLLDKAGMTYVIYDAINSEPTDIMIRGGATLYEDNQCDFLIGIGGGSPMDSMKAICAMVAYKEDIDSFMGRPITKELPPMCTIPTTAGTGSEATQFTIITDTANQVKMLLKGTSLMAKLAIIDPVFTVTAPPSVTSATGLDALTHAVEAYTSKKATTMSDMYAVSAIKRIFSSLYEAFVNPTNIEVRKEMSIAALEAGIAFNNASVTIIHGMSRPIGAVYHVPHGLSNAMLLDKCLSFIASGAEDRLCQLSKECGLFKEGMSQAEGAKAFNASISELCSKLKIQTPAEFGIDKEDFYKNIDKMADDALESGSPANTRRNPSKDDIMEIYRSLWD